MTLVLSMIVVALVLLNSMIMASGSLNLFNSTHHSIQSSQALLLAEAGIDKAVASLNEDGSYDGEDDTLLGPGSFSVQIETQGVKKVVKATGYVPSKAVSKARREIQLEVAQGDTISFAYGLLAGNGGIELSNSSTINGSVFSNGNVVIHPGAIITGDLFVAGTSVVGASGATVNGDVHAHHIQDLTIGKGAYYQTIQNSTAASLHPGSPDPAPIPLPISDPQIAVWKSSAQRSGVLVGDVSSCQGVLDAGKYVGNVALGSSCVVRAFSPIWITGNLVLNNSNIITLDSSFGSSSGVIIVDGQVILGNNNKVSGSGQGNSQILILSTRDIQTGNGNEMMLYAPGGTVNVNNNNNFYLVTAEKIILDNNSTTDFHPDSTSLFFTSGPTGGYSIIKGTYKLK